MKKESMLKTAIIFSLLVISGCELNVKSKDKTLKGSCQSESLERGLNVIGGIEDKHIFPTSVSLSIVKEGAIETCTGSFISDALLLTAGHCLKGAIALFVGSPFEPFNSQAIKSEEFFIHEEYIEEFRKEVDEIGNEIDIKFIPPTSIYADIGIAKFPAGTAPQKFIAKLASNPPTVGEDVYVVGYGNNNINGTGSGVKRFGKNKIGDVLQDFSNAVALQGRRNPQGLASDYNAVSVGSGDSGGALYNLNSEIIGTASVQLLPDNLPDSILSLYTNVHEAKTRTFLEPFLESSGEDKPDEDDQRKDQESSTEDTDDGTDEASPESCSE